MMALCGRCSCVKINFVLIAGFHFWEFDACYASH